MGAREMPELGSTGSGSLALGLVHQRATFAHLSSQHEAAKVDDFSFVNASLSAFAQSKFQEEATVATTFSSSQVGSASRWARSRRISSPAWCNPGSLDFPEPVPDAGTREAIAEIVSFVVGRRLMPVGSTLFDGDGWPVEEEAVSPWGQGIPSTCRGATLLPSR